MTRAQDVLKEGTEAQTKQPRQLDAGGVIDPLPAIDTDGLTPADLADIMRSLTAVTERLQSAHLGLQDEVIHLREQLRDKNEQLNRSRQLAALGQMAAGIAHEIRNPLGSISLYADMLAQDLSANAALQSLAVKIGRAVRDLDRIVFDVLSFSRESKPRLSSVSLSDLLERSLDGCCALLLERDVRVTLHLTSAARSAQIDADAPMLGQAIINLLRNGVEAMEGAPGTITIRALMVPLEAGDIEDGSGDQDRLKLIISDTGRGFDPHVLPRAFDPFFTTRDGGTGLGLAIVHRIIDAHGGTIRLSNNSPDPGASVEILLPARFAAPLIAQRSENALELHGPVLQGR